jgi:hypothetical protein
MLATCRTHLIPSLFDQHNNIDSVSFYTVSFIIQIYKYLCVSNNLCYYMTTVINKRVQPQGTIVSVTYIMFTFVQQARIKCTSLTVFVNNVHM